MLMHPDLTPSKQFIFFQIIKLFKKKKKTVSTLNIFKKYSFVVILEDMKNSDLISIQKLSSIC